MNSLVPPFLETKIHHVPKNRRNDHVATTCKSIIESKQSYKIHPSHVVVYFKPLF